MFRIIGAVTFLMMSVWDLVIEKAEKWRHPQNTTRVYLDACEDYFCFSFEPAFLGKLEQGWPIDKARQYAYVLSAEEAVFYCEEIRPNWFSCDRALCHLQEYSVQCMTLLTDERLNRDRDELISEIELFLELYLLTEEGHNG